jgi:hypothetical protein
MGGWTLVSLLTALALIGASPLYMPSHRALIVVSYLVVTALAVVAATVVQWRARRSPGS